MPKYKVGDHVLVKLSGGRIVEATVKVIVETTEGVRLQVSFGEGTALIYPSGQCFHERAEARGRTEAA